MMRRVFSGHSERSGESLLFQSTNPRRALLASLLFCFLASASFAGTVTGTVTNGTTGKPAAGVDVILIQLQGTMQPVASTKTDSEGHYSITNQALGAGPMLLRAVYRGVNYHEPVVPGKTNVDVQVFEPTDKPGAFTVTAHAIIFQPTGTDLGITEEYLLTNKTQPPLAFYRADGSFVYSLPQGAQVSDVSAVGASGMPVIQTPIDKGKNQQAVVFPFRPGDSSVRVSYHLPYPGNQATLRFISAYSSDRVAILAPPPMQVSSAGFAPSGQEQGFSVYMMSGQLAANAAISISVSGTAPPPAPDAGAGAADNAPTGDNSQNASVNSRIDTDNTATPVASVTTLPARIDGLKWYVVAGFAALFALGMAFLLRQPQAAFAGASEPVDVPLVEPRSSAPARPPAAQAPAPSPGAQTVASLDREVRGSLDELKDSLFRLELRREAGTIAEEDYTRERDRVQKVLRDLVKG